MAMEGTVEKKMGALAAPLPAEDISWRVTRSNGTETKAYVVPYMSARAVMSRLDVVLGPENWGDKYERWGEKGVKCRLAIRFDDKWIFKEDGAAETDIQETKGGFSDALKRVAVKWGIGRYLYRVPEFTVHLRAQGKHYHKCKDGGYRYWDAPELPAWALPGGTGGPPVGAGGGTGAGQQTGLEAGDSGSGRPGKPPGGHTGQKPKCPKCGKTATVIKDRFKADQLVCWENSPNDGGGCGHKWGQAPTKEGPAGEVDQEAAYERQAWMEESNRLSALKPDNMADDKWDEHVHRVAAGMYEELADETGFIDVGILSGKQMKALVDLIGGEQKS